MTDSSHGPFEVVLDSSKGHFMVSVFQKKMIGMRLLARIGKKEAFLKHAHRTEISDQWGKHLKWILTYVSPEDSKKSFTATMKVYGHCAVFEVENHFEISGKKKKHLFGHPYISFPCFEGEDWDDGCAMLSFKRQAPFNYPEQWQGRVVDSLREGKNSPLIISNKAFETIILSPLNQLLYGSVSISHTPPSIRCGIPRALKTIPAGTNSATLMVYGQGINMTLQKWGQWLRSYHGIEAVPMDSDVSLKYMSYWTNAGSAYWYNTHRQTSYEDTFRALKNHHDRQGLKFGSYQLDSWWYMKEGDNYTSGITEWAPKNTTLSKNFNAMLPFLQKYRHLALFKNDRISYVQSILQTPLGCHFKQLANDSVYVKEAQEDFILEGFPMPRNREAAIKLFEGVFDHPKWALAFIVHDWLQYMNDNHSGFRNISVGQEYFQALDHVCLSTEAPMNDCNHLTVQLCMTQPHMTLNSVSMQAVTSIRSTSDSDSFFVEGTKRWRWHLYASAFIQSLGKYAFYDNRQTNKSHRHPLSSYSKFEMIWLGLSCGPIGIGDRMGKENLSLIERVVKEDGEIIKPHVPCVPLDKCYLYDPHSVQCRKGVTVFTHSLIGSFDRQLTYEVIYTLTFNCHPLGGTVDMDVALMEAGAPENENYALYEYFSGELRLVNSGDMNGYRMKRRKFYYHIAAPLMKGMAFLGDVSKHVACSSQLIRHIQMEEDYCRVETCYSNRKKPSRYVFYCEKKPKKVLVDGQEVKSSWRQKKLEINVPLTNPPEPSLTGTSGERQDDVGRIIEVFG